jgi:hypothetical protein
VALRGPPGLEPGIRKRAEDAKFAKILLEIGDDEAPPKATAGVTSGGDERRLRGLPCVGRGVPGAVAGTNPAQAAIANETRQSRNGVKRRR